MNNLKEKRSAMSVMVEDWQSNGKSKKEYCLEKGINAARFYYWYSRINRKEDTPPMKNQTFLYKKIPA